MDTRLEIDRILTEKRSTIPTDAELTAETTAHCMTLPEHLTAILAHRVTLATQVDQFEIAHSLKDAKAILREGNLPRWEYHPTSEQMQTRNASETKYMYLYWRKDRYTGTYRSPGGQRKTYVGSKSANHDLARYLDAMLLRYEALQDAIRDNSYALRRISSALQQAAVRARELSAKMDLDIDALTAHIPCPWEVDDA